MKKSAEKANFATGVPRLSENAPRLFSEINAFLAQARIPRLSENASDRFLIFQFSRVFLFPYSSPKATR